MAHLATSWRHASVAKFASNANSTFVHCFLVLLASCFLWMSITHSINLFHFCQTLVLFPLSSISPLSSTLIQSHFDLLSTIFINFNPPTSISTTPHMPGSHQYSLQMTSIPSRVACVKTFETYLWCQFANSPIRQYNIWSCHSIEFPGFLHFSTAVIVSAKVIQIFTWKPNIDRGTTDPDFWVISLIVNLVSLALSLVTFWVFP